MTDMPVRQRVSTLSVNVKTLFIIQCHTPVTIIKTTYLLYLLTPSHSPWKLQCQLKHRSKKQVTAVTRNRKKIWIFRKKKLVQPTNTCGLQEEKSFNFNEKRPGVLDLNKKK